MSVSCSGLLVRVKRRLNEEPVPNLVVEVPQPTGKRRKLDSTSAQLRLLDTVGVAEWWFESGLPCSWSKAANACADWPVSPGRSSTQDAGRCDQGSIEGRKLREAGRSVVLGNAGEPVQLVDIDATRTSMKETAPTQAFSGFLIDGQPLVAVPTGAPEQASTCDEEDDSNFVWDVYAPSEPAVRTDYSDGLHSHVHLNAPLFFDVESEDVIEEDFGDIDDSSSVASSGRGSGRFRTRGNHDSSSDDDLDRWDLVPDKPWVDFLD